MTPIRPGTLTVRELDYVSGASLAIRRDLFEQLGGFDEHFAPAYYEDVDLAFRVRAAGYRVLYAPLSRVVHFEGMGAGTDETAVMGMKRYQATNRKKFVARWRGELAAHGVRGDELERQKERRIRRRAFVSDIYMLTPDRESGIPADAEPVRGTPGTRIQDNLRSLESGGASTLRLRFTAAGCGGAVSALCLLNR